MRAFLFPGQGTQTVGMGGHLRRHFPDIVGPLWEEAERLVSYPLVSACENGPVEVLRQMPVTQPAVFMCSWTTLEVARSLGIDADVVAGHSLGEYSALAAAGVLQWREVLQLVHQRGILMARVQASVRGKMAAIIGCSLAQVESTCDAVSDRTGEVVEVANHNESHQVVVSGQNHAVDELVRTISSSVGTRTTVLRIGGPAHSSLMGDVAEEFTRFLGRFEFRCPQVELVSGSTGQAYTSGQQVKDQLGAQLVHRVRWVDVMTELARRGVEETWELGPGRVLSGFVERALPHVHTHRSHDLAAFLDASSSWSASITVPATDPVAEGVPI